MLLKHGFLFQANDGGDGRPSRLKRRIHGRNWVSARRKPNTPGRPQILKWTLDNGTPVLDFLVQSPPLRCWDYIRARRGRAGRARVAACDFPCGPVPGYAVSHSVLLLLKATLRTPPSSPLLLILTFPELS